MTDWGDGGVTVGRIYPPKQVSERRVMSDKNAGLRSELTPIVNDAFKRASSAQQAALPDAAPFVQAIIDVVGRYIAFDALEDA